MAAEQRKLLEKLMGADAMGFKPRSQYQEVDLYDPKICKSFLVGTCVHDMFAATKDDLGPCPKLHLERHKVEYDIQVSKGKAFPEFDLEYERELERYAMDVKRRIDTNEARLEKTPEDIARLNEATRKIEQINTSIAISIKEIQTLGELGETGLALEKLNGLNSIRQEKELKEKELKTITEVAGFSGYQKLQVCHVCGAYMSRLDTDRRLADHYIGKMHKGYLQLRECYDAIKEKNRKRRRGGA